MFIQQDSTTATYQIQAYEPGKIWINQACYEQNVMIRPDELIIPWLVNDFKPIIDNPPEILLLGTGAQLIIPPQALLTPLLEKGIGVEFMDSKTACFTYTALACENRRLAACIMIL